MKTEVDRGRVVYFKTESETEILNPGGPGVFYAFDIYFLAGGDLFSGI